MSGSCHVRIDAPQQFASLLITSSARTSGSAELLELAEEACDVIALAMDSAKCLSQRLDIDLFVSKPET
jgi:hypothetical protein